MSWSLCHLRGRGVVVGPLLPVWLLFSTAVGYRDLEPLPTQSFIGPGVGRGDWQQDNCAEVKDCYCIKLNYCGWCKSMQQASMQQGHCKDPDWIVDPYKCPTLHCRDDPWPTIRSLIQVAILPISFALLWLVVYLWRRCLTQEMSKKVEEQDEFSSRVSFTDGRASYIGSMEPHVCDPIERPPAEADDFFGTVRTYEAFRAGIDCPVEWRMPSATKRKYTVNVQVMCLDSSEKAFQNMRVPAFRLFKTFGIALQWRSALGSNLTWVCGMMFLGSLNIAIISVCAQVVDEEVYWSLALFAKETESLVQSLQVAVSLLLSFYALNRIGWWWAIMRVGWQVQGRAHDLGMVAGAALGDSERECRAKYAFYRHIIMCFFLAYQPYTPAFQFVGFKPFVQCGLLTSEEVAIIEKSHSAPRTVIESWLTRWAQTHLTDMASRQQTILAVREFRGKLAAIGDMIDERAPVSFESLLYIAVYALCLLIPFSPKMDYEDRQTVLSAQHIAAVLGDGVLIAFYISQLHLLYHLQAPYDSVGAPLDCLNPMAILNTTEKKLRDYLCTPPSPSIFPGGSGDDGYGGGILPAGERMLSIEAALSTAAGGGPLTGKGSTRC